MLWLSKSPQITDEHLQTTPPLLSAQVGTLVGLDLSGLGLTNFQLKKLFPNQPNVVAALSLDDNQYTSTGRIFSARNRFSELRAVFLRNNRLNSLDQGGFWGLRLGLLALDGNPGAPFAVEPRLQVKDGTNQVRAQFNIAIPATTTFQVYGTNMTVDAFELVIPAGTNVSEWVEPSRDNQTLPVLLRSSLLAEMPMTYTGLKLTPPEEALSAAKLWWNRGDGANRLPVLVKAFESLKIFIGSSVSNEEYSSVVLSDHVRPVNVSRALTFEIVSSDPAVATATLNDDMLTVNAHADGGAILTVNATDHNVTQPFTFDVTVATIDRTGYNIDVHKIGAAETNATISNAIDRAVAFWESMLMDVGDIPVKSGADLSCYNGGVFPNQSHVDDMAIIIAVVPIDGPGGTLASATVCGNRDDESFGDEDQLSVLGRFVLDVADAEELIDEDGIYSVFVHEIGHIFGIGLTWYAKAPVGGPTYESETRYGMVNTSPFGLGTIFLRGADVAFLGKQAYSAWMDAGGADDPFTLDGTPVATTGGAGSFGVHWDETHLDDELMTPFYDGDVSNPFSAISFNSLADMGYTLNTTFTPETYVLPSSRSELAGSSDEYSRVFDLTGDVQMIPIRGFDAAGRITGVFEPSGLHDAENQRRLRLIDDALRRAGPLLDLDENRDNNR